jgi:uncharacterized protein YlxP (DUF503 family)
MRAEWSGSLKEKRMIVKSITERSRNKFNISVAEVDAQDAHKDIVIGFACVSNERAHAESIVQNVVRFIETHTDAVVNDVVVEIL